MFDIKNQVSHDALMIAWRLHTSPHIATGAIFIDLVYFSTKGKLPELIVVVLINLESLLEII
jgi:hypothetical protein